MWIQFFYMLPMLVCLFWAVTLLVDYLSGRSRAVLALHVFMLMTTVLYFGHYAFFTWQSGILALSDTLYGMANLAVYPLYLIYIIRLTHERVRPWQYLILLPALLALVAYGTLYALMTPQETERFLSLYLRHNQTSGLGGAALWQAGAHIVSRYLFVALVVIVLLRGYAYLSAFERQVAALYADIEGRTLRPIRIILHLLLFTSLASVVFSIVGRYSFYDSALLVALPSLMFSMLLYCIGYAGHRPMFFSDDLLAEQQATGMVTAGAPSDRQEYVSQTRMKALAEDIERLMLDEQFFLRHDVRVADVARQLGTNGKYVSIAINQVLGISFTDYVNRMRIGHACELHRKQPKLTVGEVARRSGYDSMQSFYRNLKRWGKDMWV